MIKECKFEGEYDTVVEIGGENLEEWSQNYREKLQYVRSFITEPHFEESQDVLSQVIESDWFFMRVRWHGAFWAVVDGQGGTDEEILSNAKARLRKRMGKVKLRNELVR